MRCLRTPEDRFADLPGFAYLPQYADLGGVRLAWVEAGPPDGEPVLLLHGEPSWSFLYRTVMAVLAEAGLHAIAVSAAPTSPPTSATTATHGTWTGSGRWRSTSWTCAR
jgi:haloalkane dehalogenase